LHVAAGAKQSLKEAPNKLSRAVAKLASITFWSLAFSWTDKPSYLTEGKFSTVLIIPSSWGSQLGGHPARIKHSFLAPLPRKIVTTQDFIKFWGKIFVFILLVLIENSQGFKTFEFI
jgi:hypothetical protein